jgi:hypothetical protein
MTANDLIFNLVLKENNIATINEINVVTRLGKWIH